MWYSRHYGNVCHTEENNISEEEDQSTAIDRDMNYNHENLMTDTKLHGFIQLPFLSKQTVA
jgi:hypothetical protein